MKMINKDARQYLLNECTIYSIGVSSWNMYKDKYSGYIGNRRKHNRAPVAIQHTKGKYLTARQRCRV